MITCYKALAYPLLIIMTFIIYLARIIIFLFIIIFLRCAHISIEFLDLKASLKHQQDIYCILVNMKNWQKSSIQNCLSHNSPQAKLMFNILSSLLSSNIQNYLKCITNWLLRTNLLENSERTWAIWINLIFLIWRTDHLWSPKPQPTGFPLGWQARIPHVSACTNNKN